MGAALPMAVAAAVYRPDDPTILAIGDGGLGMFFAELHLAATERAPLLVLFMHDGTYASIRNRAVSRGLSDRSLIARDPDWSAVAAAMEFVAGRADSLAEVSMFVDKWAVKGPAFLEIRFDPEAYRKMTAKLRA
jgi:acetolactate synthase-1/2/3 large subunit